MALTFGVEVYPEDIGAPPFARARAPWARPAGFARDWLARGKIAKPRASNVSSEWIRRENASIAEAFARSAARIGLTAEERAILLGGAPDPSRVIMALETLGAALDLCATPRGALGWLRAEIPHAPFNGRAPLALIAADGGYGAEIALLYLRARLRTAALT